MTINPKQVLNEAEGLISERGQDYGGIEDNFSNIAIIFTAMTGKQFTAHDVAMVLAAVKIARMRQSPGKADNYLDAINYVAFAHELRPQASFKPSSPHKLGGGMTKDPETGIQIWVEKDNAGENR
jgi:hypothetical protein